MQRSLLSALLITVSFTTSLLSQTFDWITSVQLSTPANTFGRTTAIDNNGNIYLAGVYDSAPDPEPTGMHINKYSADGQLLWSNIVRAGSSYVRGGSVFVDQLETPWLICYSASGKILVGAQTYTGSRTFLVHYSETGSLISVKTRQ